MSMKNPLTPAGIEPATFRFVAQHLNHCAITVPYYKEEGKKIFYCFECSQAVPSRSSRKARLEIKHSFGYSKEKMMGRG